MQIDSLSRETVLALLASLLAGIFAVSCASVDPAHRPVTYENLYEREQDWPFHVMLTEAWKPEGFEGESFSHAPGVLVRVEPSGDLRVDYARSGRHRVPARVTNVIAEANRIRVGDLPKPWPNFVLVIANKLLDPKTEPLRYVRPFEVGHIKTYVIVAADPATEAFAEIAHALAPIRARADVMGVLFPQGGHSDQQVLERCREVEWTDPFLFSRFVPGFVAAVFGDDVQPASVVLQSPEGRLLHASSWSQDTPASLAKAIDQELGRSQPADEAERRGSEQEPAS